MQWCSACLNSTKYMDKAGKKYWDSIWDAAPIPDPVDPRIGGLNNYVNREFHRYFQRTFAEFDPKGKRLLEVGCARSAWLPYFAREFGFIVHGLDYSELGCRQAERALAKLVVPGEIFCADLFAPPLELVEAYDVVVSFGVVEHFEDTRTCIAALAQLLKPGGLLITNIPNMNGLHGFVQRILNRKVFDIHVPLTAVTLAAAHNGTGLTVRRAEYVVVLNLSAINDENLRGSWRYNVSVRVRSWISKVTWLCSSVLPFVKPNRWTSPNIHCLAIKVHP